MNVNETQNTNEDQVITSANVTEVIKPEQAVPMTTKVEDTPELIEPISISPDSVMDTNCALVSEDHDALIWKDYKGLKFGFRDLSGLELDSIEGKAMQFDAVQLLEVSGLPENERLRRLRDSGLKTTMSPEKRSLEKVYLMMADWNLTQPRLGVNGKPLFEGKKMLLDPLEISRDNIKRLKPAIWQAIKGFVVEIEKSLRGTEQIKN